MIYIERKCIIIVLSSHYEQQTPTQAHKRSHQGSLKPRQQGHNNKTACSFLETDDHVIYIERKCIIIVLSSHYEQKTPTQAHKRSHQGSLKPRQQGHNNKTACSFLETDDHVIYIERKCIIIVLSSHYEQQTPTQAHKRSHQGSLKPRQQGHNNKTACSLLETDDRVIYIERKCIIIVLSSHYEQQTPTQAHKRSHQGSLKPRQQGHNNKTACSFLETDDHVIYIERKCIIIVLSSHYEQQTPTQAHKRSHQGSLKPRQQGHNNKTACSFLETDDHVIYIERKCIIIVLSSHYEQQTPTQAHKRSHQGSLKPRQQGHNNKTACSLLETDDRVIYIERKCIIIVLSSHYEQQTPTQAHKRSHQGSLKPRQQGHNNKTACSFLETDERVIYLERKCIIIVLSSHYE